MVDRDLEIGRLQAAVESYGRQNADQFRRLDALEVAVGRLEERVEALRSRLDALGAPDPSKRSLPALAYSWRFWMAAVAGLGVLLGLWTWQDVVGVAALGGGG